MKKLYEVKVEKVDAYMGRFEGWQNVAYTLDANKAEEIKEAKIVELEARDGWWMNHGRVWETQKPNVVVVELGEVVE